uniref:Uncharacterized protein n=1 Tax=Arundo donax TaxID=35708 RepID=A0A0A9A8D6_ARUDO
MDSMWFALIEVKNDSQYMQLASYLARN